MPVICLKVKTSIMLTTCQDTDVYANDDGYASLSVMLVHICKALEIFRT